MIAPSALAAAVAAVVAELEEPTDGCSEYVGSTDDPKSIILDGHFNIERLVRIALEAAHSA